MCPHMMRHQDDGMVLVAEACHHATHGGHSIHLERHLEFTLQQGRLHRLDSLRKNFI